MTSWLPEEYILPTGYAGVAIFWGGLAAQVGVLVTLGVVSDATSQPVGVVFAAYFLSMGIYFAIDLAYVFLFEMRVLNEFLFTEAKLDAKERGEVFVTPTMERPALLPVFFLYAAFSALSCLFVHSCCVETRGCTLDEIEKRFAALDDPKRAVEEEGARRPLLDA